MRPLLALTVFLFVSPADAAAIPDHNVDAACRATMTSPLTVGACIREEQAAYAVVRVLWPQLSPDHQVAAAQAAERQARHGQYMFYKILANFTRRELALQQQAQDRAGATSFQKW